jgi:hypothetical protein
MDDHVVDAGVMIGIEFWTTFGIGPGPPVVHLGCSGRTGWRGRKSSRANRPRTYVRRVHPARPRPPRWS